MTDHRLPPFPGRGATGYRVASCILAVIPLLAISFGASEVADRSKGWEKALVFTAALLVSSFAYDALKVVLVSSAAAARALFHSLWPLLVFVCAYVLFVAAIALVDMRVDVLREYPALLLVALTLLFVYLATQSFLRAVHSGMRG